MEILGFVILLALVIAAVAVLVATGVIRPWRGGSNTPPPSDPVTFSIRPKIICNKAECGVTIDYSVQSAQAGAAVSLTVRTPSNTTKPVSNQMQLRQTIAGDDPFWSDGPGQYTLTWRATGLLQGNITNVHDVHVIPSSGGKIPDFISFAFGANDRNRRVAGDIAIFGTVSGRKGRALDTCEKYMALVSVRYLSGGIAGYPNDLAVNVADGSGGSLGTAVLKPLPGADTLLLASGVPIQNGIAIESQMASGIGPEFPIGQSIPWILEYTFNCL